MLLCFVILLVGFHVLEVPNTVDTEHTPPETPVLSTYTDSTYHLAFMYPGGREGYMIVEPEVGSDIDGLRKIIVLQNAEAQAQANNSPANGESAPTITILILENTNKQDPRAWAEAHTLYSNIGLLTGDIASIRIDDTDAIRFMADGLYASEITIVAYGSYIYIINGAYIDAESSLRRDYVSLVNSLNFSP